MRVSKITWIIFSIIAIFYCYEFFLRISPSILIDQIMSQYHVSALGIGAFSSSYFLGYLLMQIPAGFILDHYDFKKGMIVALLACVLGTIIFTVSSSIEMGLLARFILGCGSAFAFIGAISFVKKVFYKKYFTLLMSFVISFGTIIGAFGQTIAVNVIHYLSWQFTISGISIWGAILAIALFLIPTVYFAACKRKNLAEKPIAKPLSKIIRNKLLWFNGIVGSFMYIPTSIISTTWGIQFFSKQYHFTDAQGTIGITILFTGWALGSPLFGWLSERNNEKKTLYTSVGLLTIILLILILSPALSLSFFYLLLFLFGLISSAQVLVWKIFDYLVPENCLVGLASSFTNLLIMLGVAIADLLLGQLINLFQHYHHQSMFDAIDLKLALLILPMLTVSSIIFIRFLPQCIKLKEH